MDGRIHHAELRAILLQKEPHQVRNIIPALPQWRQIQHHHADPVIQILAKLVLADGGLGVAMGGGDDADIHGDGFLPAKSLQAFFLQDPASI